MTFAFVADDLMGDLAGLCKGSTADSDSVCEGSNPSPAAKNPPFPFGNGGFFRFL